jgi:hypothetical protein
MNLFKPSGMATGLAVGAGFFLLAPVARVFSGAGRPLLKEAFKGGLFVYNRGRTIWAETRESLEDITAEARSELDQAKQLPAGSGSGSTPHWPGTRKGRPLKTGFRSCTPSPCWISTPGPPPP